MRYASSLYIGTLANAVTGGGGGAPTAPTLTAPGDATTWFNGETITVSASTPDGDLDRIDWVLDGSTVVATDNSAPYSTTWAISGLSVGNHTLVARAIRGAQQTDSTSITITIVNPALRVHSYFASGTETPPANFLATDFTRSTGTQECWGAGGGGTTATGGGGGGAYARIEQAMTPSSGLTVTVGTSAANTDGGDTSIAATCIAKGGLSGGNGGTGGQASASTGSTKFDGGNGVAGAGTVMGGGSAGDAGAGSGATAGANNGAIGDTVAGRGPGAGGHSTAAAQGAGGRGEARFSYLVPAPTGFSRPISYSYGRDTANATSRNITIPPGSGGKLVLIVFSDGPTITIAGTGWNSVSSGTDGAQISGAILERTADGADPVAITTSASEQVSWLCLRVVTATGGTPGAPTSPAPATGNSTNPNPPSHTPGAGSDNYLWIAACGIDENTSSTITAPPTGYDEFVVCVPPATSNGVQLCVALLYATGTTQDPAAFTAGTEQWVAFTASIPSS